MERERLIHFKTDSPQGVKRWDGVCGVLECDEIYTVNIQNKNEEGKHRNGLKEEGKKRKSS